MSQASNYYSILTAVQSVIQGLGLVDWNNNAVQTIVRKTPAFRRQVDSNIPPPVIYISRAKRPERVEPKVFGDTVWVWYPVMLSVLAAGNQDLTVQVDYYLQWRQQLRRAFQDRQLSGVSAVWDSNMLPETLLDEGTIAKNWDAELLTVEFRTAEQRLTT